MLLWVAIVGGLLVVVGFGLWRLLGAVTERGGGRSGDAARFAVQSIAQLRAFSGKRSDDRPVWDGEERMKGFQGNDGATGG